MAHVSVFHYEDYKAFVRDWVKSQAGGGHGLFRRLAAHLKVHSTLISQVFSGSRELSPEQALQVAEFLVLTVPETDYLLGLVDAQRTASPKLRAAVLRRLQPLRAEQEKIEHRIGKTQVLSVHAQAQFYSHWFFTAISLAIELDGVNTPEALAARLALPLPSVLDALEFLTAQGLVVHERGKLGAGTIRTHIGADAPMVAAHHRNWRLKAVERHPFLGADDFAFTAPMTLAAADFAKVRRLLLELIEAVDGLVRPSPAQALACLNIDLFKL